VARAAAVVEAGQKARIDPAFDRNERLMTTSTVATLDPLVTSEMAGCDGLRLTELPFVPEVRLYRADDAIVLQARLEATVGHRLPPALWANAWLGGQGLARYVLDHPQVVAGRRVLDVASGSGLVAIAAAMAGAASVAANDIDPHSLAAITMNARANGVTVDLVRGDLLGGDGGDADVVLAGDVFYGRALAGQMMRLFERAAARGAYVLIGDPGRDHLPLDRLQVLASYPVTAADAPQDALLTTVHVLQPRAGGFSVT
jgi:predicted nicotinamide N-methyase